jgi:hypothetical protein
MSAGEEAESTEAFEWFVEADQAAPAAAGKSSWARREEKRANSVGIAITTSLLFVLCAAAILVGGRAAIAPLLRHAVNTRETNGVGDLVYTMPDGVFCRHMSFDNTTAEVVEGGIEPCPDPIGRRRQAEASKFEWGGH